ncbi:lysophospholipid acyltransferase family protein [Anaerocolumna xylanovorans]|uniref:1-acyl-sn-glycerol-3-phosphate acyltransferase n=1 Tax=Anaerocolumna xylanovorans DSM 12503 TaxID=1121345 RepID=A0A1M7YK84_9FIRM|nr:lysophospholipid acyltransferase family protein [Anaerocolumna xylanovorans]SHO52948.1 1-acyl-sn-glycerol-3-phosphate acyltransferase [Anaerocolumna xylanovorans DSM 12503]
MKTLIVLLFLLVFFIVSLPVFLYEIILGKINPRKKAASSQRIVSWAFHVILFLSGAKYEVKGLENVPKDQAVLYVSNHRSYFDIVLAYSTVPTLTGFVAKKEIKKVPILRVWMKYLNCLFLDRDNPREGLKMILTGVELVKQGYSVFISPEGTRNHGEDMLPFKEGSLKIAEKTGCPIIPVALTNTDNLFENHTPWIRRAHVTIEYGKPVYADSLSKEERKFLGSYVQNIIRTMLEKNAKETS